MSATRCGRCTLEDVQKVADAAGGRVEIRLRGEKLPAGLENQEQYSGPQRFGYDLFIVYPTGLPAWACWLSHLQITCWCRFLAAAEQERAELV